MQKKRPKKIISENILALIEDNQLKIGEKLPPERKLSQMLSSSRNTVREAIRMLEIRGRVKTKSGSGCFITSLEDTADWASLRGDADTKVLKEHMQAIAAIEPLIVSQAVENSSPEDIKSLKQIMAQLGNAIINHDTPEIVNEMIEFTRRVSKISGNRFFMLIIREMDLERQILSKILSKCSPERVQDIFKTHVEVVNCFQHRDAKLATELFTAGRELRHQIYWENVR